MNTVSLLFLAAIGVLAFLMVARMSYAILHNFHAGREFRRALGERVHRLRLFRMLERRGISPADYLHRQPVTDIERHARVCEGCDETRACDGALAARATTQELTFCPNDRELREYKRLLAIDEKHPSR